MRWNRRLFRSPSSVHNDVPELVHNLLPLINKCLWMTIFMYYVSAHCLTSHCTRNIYCILFEISCSEYYSTQMSEKNKIIQWQSFCICIYISNLHQYFLVIHFTYHSFPGGWFLFVLLCTWKSCKLFFFFPTLAHNDSSLWKTVKMSILTVFPVLNPRW